MTMLSYIAAVKRGLRDKHGFKPKCDGADPIFEHGQIPDGTYPMRIEGKIDHVKIVNGFIHCCNFKPNGRGRVKRDSKGRGPAEAD